LLWPLSKVRLVASHRFIVELIDSFLRDRSEWVASLSLFSLSFQSLSMGLIPEHPFRCVSYIPSRRSMVLRQNLEVAALI
jgi:hypothetical protein